MLLYKLINQIEIVMLITTKIIAKTDKSTIRELYINGAFVCYTLEDPQRKIKIAKQTGIPDGVYDIGFRDDVTPMTERYRDKYSSFFWNHLEIKGVPNFEYIYIHIGNFPKNTDGCLLVGQTRGDDAIYQSTLAFKKLYTRLASALMRGEQIQIKIGD